MQHSNPHELESIELEEPKAVDHVGDLSVGDRVLIGERSKPLTVVDVGVRVIGDSRTEVKEIETPVAKLQGDWENAVEVVISHQITRWVHGEDAIENVLRERETIVEMGLGKPVDPKRTHVVREAYSEGPAGGSNGNAEKAVACDGGRPQQDETEMHVPDEDCVLMTDGGQDGLPRLHVGDHVVDRDADPDDSATMLVVNLDTLLAVEHEVDDDGTTVADVNPDYSKTDDVVEVTFPQRTDLEVDKKRYAYPRGRLALKQPIHDRERGGEFDDDAVPTWGAVKTIAEHIVESHTNIDNRLNDIEDRLDRAERDIDIIDGGY